MLDVSVRHNKNEVHMAIVQFVARRSYVLSKPWYIEGIRIEAPHGTTIHGADAASRMGGAAVRSGDENTSGSWWASMWDLAQCPRVEVELGRRRGRTRVKIKLSNHPDSILLAFELQAYLLDDRTYENHCPPMCPACGSPVPVVIARYCGRCGKGLLARESDELLPPVFEPPAPESGKSPPISAADVVIERDDESAAEEGEAEIRALEPSQADLSIPGSVHAEGDTAAAEIEPPPIEDEAAQAPSEQAATPNGEAEAISEAEPEDKAIEPTPDADHGNDNEAEPRRRALAEE